ncbi:MAG: guanylate kinase [Eubacteriales bacterium]|nr:guanylate kinase [Eubacteriales bacterium]
MDQGLLIVLSGPSGTGKGTVCKVLMEKRSDIALSISCTTRKPRVDEKEGVHYFFISEQEFNALIEKEAFFEYANVYDNYYGTPKSFVRSKLSEGKDVLLEIDVQGALNAKKAFPDGVYIFLVPPSIEELECRIRSRGTEKEEQIQKRLSKASGEMKLVDEYDYIIVNDRVDKVVKSIENIIEAEKLKVSRNRENFEYLRSDDQA